MASPGSSVDATRKGLVLFPPNTSRQHRRRRLVFVASSLLVASLLLWPIFPLVARVFPLVLGLPFSFAWVVLALVFSFSALLFLFLGDEAESINRGEP